MRASKTKTAINRQTASKQPVDWVDPLIDTANRRFFFLTTASHPFGMVNLSPDTRVGLEAWGSGYRYDDGVNPLVQPRPRLAALRHPGDANPGRTQGPSGL